MKQDIFFKIVLSVLIFLISNEEVSAQIRTKRAAKYVPPSSKEADIQPKLFCEGPCAPTVRAAGQFNAGADADALKKAMKGIGTRNSVIISILTKRSSTQRLEIAESYKVKYGSELVSDLKGETSGTLENVIVALMSPLPVFYANELRAAINGAGTDETTLVEIICSVNNAGIKSIAKYYQSLHGKSLESDVRGDTTGTFQKLLVSLIQGKRQESPNVDNKQAAADAKALQNAGAKKWGTDDSVFNNILVTRSFPQLRQIFVEYQKLTKRDIELDVKKEFSGKILTGMMALVKVIKSRPTFLAEQIKEALNGAGTKDRALTRIVVSRSEIDLADIKKAYPKVHKKSLDSDIKGDVSGDYQKILISILNG